MWIKTTSGGRHCDNKKFELGWSMIDFSGNKKNKNKKTSKPDVAKNNKNIKN